MTYRPTTQTISSIALLILTVPLTYGEPPTQIFGTYSRLSRTCGGGPGFADSVVKMHCNSVFEDRLTVTPPLRALTDEIELSPNSVSLEFQFHFNYSDYCAFTGYAT